MYLFDTDVITNILKKRPSQNLVMRLQDCDKSSQFISVITVMEIIYGAYKSSRPEYHLEKLENVILPAVNIARFGMKSAHICGKLKADLELKGRRLSLADLQIAAIAIADELILITGNISHFERIPGLKTENWL
jgi:predicted nucleic acid-binding protein